MPTVVFNFLPVDKGFIYWTDYYGYLEVWTQSRNYGDLVYQFSCNCPLDKNPFDLIMDNYESGNFIWEGDEHNA